MTTSILKRTVLAAKYLEMLADADYRLIDLNLIEPIDAKDALAMHSENTFERGGRWYHLRSDWTRSLVAYSDAFDKALSRYGYFGPVVRHKRTYYQAGMELYQAELPEMLAAIQMHLDFIQAEAGTNIQTIIVNDLRILGKYQAKYDLSEEVMQVVAEKDLSSLAELLGREHAIYQLLAQPVKQQFAQIQAEFKGEADLAFLEGLQALLEGSQSKFLVDLSFTPPHSYYNGIYFQAFLTDYQPILTGGQYGNQSFGIGIDLSQGGLS